MRSCFLFLRLQHATCLGVSARCTTASTVFGCVVIPALAGSPARLAPDTFRDPGPSPPLRGATGVRRPLEHGGGSIAAFAAPFAPGDLCSTACGWLIPVVPGLYSAVLTCTVLTGSLLSSRRRFYLLNANLRRLGRPWLARSFLVPLRTIPALAGCSMDATRVSTYGIGPSPRVRGRHGRTRFRSLVRGVIPVRGGRRGVVCRYRNSRGFIPGRAGQPEHSGKSSTRPAVQGWAREKGSSPPTYPMKSSARASSMRCSRVLPAALAVSSGCSGYFGFFPSVAVQSASVRCRAPLDLCLCH